MKERITEWREALSVKWFMLDAQQKQAVILIGIALWQGIIEVLSSRLTKKEGAKHE
jgi:hypothetical protein